MNTMTKEKSRPWKLGDKVTDEEFRLIRYATRMRLLQERVPLTFVQARIYLREEKSESIEDIATRFGLSPEEVERAEPYIRGKVEEAMKERDIFFGHEPIIPDNHSDP